MAYSWEDTANEILKQKKIWNDATYEKNSSLADQAAKTAAGYYDTLRQNGDGALADALQSRDIVSAQKYFDTYKNNKNMVQGAYNRGGAIDSVVNQKKAWNDATYDKNTAFAGQATSNAQSIYNWMRDNGDEKTAQMQHPIIYEAHLPNLFVEVISESQFPCQHGRNIQCIPRTSRHITPCFLTAQLNLFVFRSHIFVWQLCFIVGRHAHIQQWIRKRHILHILT